MFLEYKPGLFTELLDYNDSATIIVFMSAPIVFSVSICA